MNLVTYSGKNFLKFPENNFVIFIKNIMGKWPGMMPYTNIIESKIQYPVCYCYKVFKNVFYNEMNFPITLLKSSFENGLRRFASKPYFLKSIIAGLKGEPVTTIALP